MTPMASALLFFGAIAVLAGGVVLVDWWGRRRDRLEQERLAR